MSKTLLLIFILIISITVHAQLSKGKIFLGGVAGFGHQTTQQVTESKSDNLYFSPSIGAFYKNNRLAGISLNYNRSSSKGSNTVRTNNYGVGVFLRQYKQLGKSFFVFADETLATSFGKTTDSGNPEFYNKTWDIRAGFKPGISYQLTNCIQLELLVNDVISVGYNESKRRTTNLSPERTIKGFNIKSDLNLNLLQNTGVGFRFIF